MNGSIVCDCSNSYPVNDSVIDLRPSTLGNAERAQAKFFTDEAESYERDVVESRFYQALDARSAGRWAEGLDAGSCVLEIGTGTGRIAIRLARAGHDVLALDLTEALVTRGRQKARAAGVDARICWVLGDAAQLPVTDGAFDAAICHGVLHHIDEPGAVIRQAGRALRPGGRWFSLDPHRSPLRGIFDALMRVWPLWREEASSDPLQTSPQLLRWCAEAGLSARTELTCYVPPHLLGLLPVRGIEWALAVTDALLRNVPTMRTWAGVITVDGHKGSAPPAQARRRGRAIAPLLLLGGIAAFTTPVDTGIALRSPSYYVGGLESYLRVANSAGALGATLVLPDGRPVESEMLDDVGYLLMGQLIAVSGIEVTGARLVTTHQALFLLLTLATAIVAWAHSRSAGAGAVTAGALLLIGDALSHLRYAQVSNQTFTTLLPLAILPCLILLVRALATGKRVFLVGLLCGVVIGGTDLVRHSHGVAALFASGFLLLLGLRWFTRSALRATIAMALGFVMAVVVLPAALKVHRDIALARFQTFSVAYLRRPRAHHVAYTLLTAVGRYPNSLGLFYEDKTTDAYIAANTQPPPRDVNDVVEAARPLFLSYVRAHPKEWVSHVARGFAEVPLFVLYTTFQAPRQWDLGWPGITEGLQVDDRDRARYGKDLLMNVRVSYLRLAWWQGVLALSAVLVIALGLLELVRSRQREAWLLAFALVVYLAWVWIPRALIPVQGSDAVMVFWATAVICGITWRRFAAAQAETARDPG